MTNGKVFQMDFGKVYGLLLDKAARKGRTRAEADEVIRWLTRYSPGQLESSCSTNLCYGDFFRFAPETKLKPSAMGSIWKRGAKRQSE